MPGQRVSGRDDRFSDRASGVDPPSGSPERDSPGVGSDGERDSSPLTAREKTVLRLLVEGRRNLEISTALGISERTVKFHVSGLFAKLGVRSRTQVVAKALQQGLVDV